jgi:hypothetical protein
MLKIPGNFVHQAATVDSYSPKIQISPVFAGVVSVNTDSKDKNSPFRMFERLVSNTTCFVSMHHSKAVRVSITEGIDQVRGSAK